MSTRGTYQVLIRIYGGNGFPSIHRTQCFYKHCDNYPSGAAESLSEALALEWKYQVHGKNMIKRLAACDGYEFIDSHDDRGDTKYRYNIWENDKEIFIEGWERSIIDEEESWSNFFEGTLSDFISKYKIPTKKH